MKPLAVAVGDPAGIGPEVTAAALPAFPDERFVVFGPPAATVGAHAEREDLGIVDAVPPGVVSEEAGRAQLAWLDAAIDAVRDGRCRALVTGPTCKESIARSGTPFTGQTERLAERAGLAPEDVTMMFLGPRLKVALATTHLSVRDAAAILDAERVGRTIRHLREALGALEAGVEPRIVVTGVNPHAGEGGLFGNEEARFADVCVALDARGPLPAEHAFRAAVGGRADGVVAMLHDQATIASKLLDFGDAVNVTWGLPFVRCSVDHGVAFDIAGKGIADAAGMKAAIAMARTLAG